MPVVCIRGLWHRFSVSSHNPILKVKIETFNLVLPTDLRFYRLFTCYVVPSSGSSREPCSVIACIVFSMYSISVMLLVPSIVIWLLFIREQIFVRNMMCRSYRCVRSTDLLFLAYHPVTPLIHTISLWTGYRECYARCSTSAWWCVGVSRENQKNATPRVVCFVSNEWRANNLWLI